MEWKWYPCLGWSCEGRPDNAPSKRVWLVTTWGFYPIQVCSTEAKALAVIDEENAKRKKVPGVARGEYRIIELEIDGDYKHELHTRR